MPARRVGTTFFCLLAGGGWGGAGEGRGDRGQGRYVRAGDPGWRGRLISHAPRLGRTGDGAPPPDLRDALLPPPLTRGSGGAPLRTGDTVCPHAPRLRGRQPIRQEERGERAVGIEDKAGQGRGVDGVRALCGGGWPGLARAADLAGSAARPNGGRRAPPPGLRGALPRPANAWQWRRAAPNRGDHLPARSAAPRASPIRQEGERRRRESGGRRG